jgi:hypothetical protein
LPISGYVRTRICPLYEGSVSVSGYPVMPVLKTTSPAAEQEAPKEMPVYTEPSSRTSRAFIKKK